MADTEPKGGFLVRWSERKRPARLGTPLPAEPPLADPVPSADSRSAAQAARGPDHPPAAARVLTDADMPPLETLDEHSDYAGFLSRGVSPTLRRQALSRLFHSPHLGVASGLDDFPEDYTRFEGLGDLITADMRHQAEAQARRLAARAEAASADAAAPAEPVGSIGSARAVDPPPQAGLNAAPGTTGADRPDATAERRAAARPQGDPV